MPSPDVSGPADITSDEPGLIIIHTGNGKGKTTAALGVLLRATGSGQRVAMFQFLKHTQARFGEHRAAVRMGLRIESLGDGFTWRSRDLDQTGALAAEQWRRCREALADTSLDVVILDEVTYVIRNGWVPIDEVLAALAVRPVAMHVVLTGRGAPPELVEVADLVTEMHLVKHPYREQGIKAQPGIEF